jgi:hypothetical protein
MRILESTQRRLAIGFEHSSTENLCLAMWVNIFVTIYFKALLNISPAFKYHFWILSFAIGWLLIHLLYPGNKRTAGYWFTGILGSIPILGVALSSFTVLSLLQFPQTASLTFDKDENFLIVKTSFKILFWQPVIQYPLDEIIGFTLSTKTVYTSANPVLPVSVVCLARRRQNGRIRHKEIVGGADANQSLIDRINTFLVI